MSIFIADCDHVRVNTLAMEIIGTRTERGHLTALSCGRGSKLARLARRRLAKLNARNAARRAEIARIEARHGWN